MDFAVPALLLIFVENLFRNGQKFHAPRVTNEGSDSYAINKKSSFLYLISANQVSL